MMYKKLQFTPRFTTDSKGKENICSMPLNSNTQSKTKEGCGKWLTTKGKSNPIKSCVKPSSNQSLRKQPRLRISEPNANSEVTRSFVPPISAKFKLSNMKQTKINKFLMNKPNQCSNSVGNSLQMKIPISFPMKSGYAAMDLNDYDDLWGSESDDEDGQHKIFENDDEQQEKMFSTPKKFKKADDSDSSAMPRFYMSQNDFPFTQWFQDQVDEFCKCSSEIEKSDLVKDILSSVPYCCRSPLKSNQCKQKSSTTLLFQFSEWFNQQVKTFSSRDSSSKDNVESSESWTNSPSKISKQSFAFTQWFEENLEKCLKSQESEIP